MPDTPDGDVAGGVVVVGATGTDDAGGTVVVAAGGREVAGPAGATDVGAVDVAGAAATVVDAGSSVAAATCPPVRTAGVGAPHATAAAMATAMTIPASAAGRGFRGTCTSTV